MLEIILLAKLCSRIGRAARDKGRRALGYQLLLILFWFGGELGVALISGLMLALLYGDQAERYYLYAYIAAIAGAAFGAWLSFQIVACLPNLRDDRAELFFGAEEKPIRTESNAITDRPSQ